jgi:hypothetical protein
VGLLKWLVVFFILAIIALLVLPVPVLHAIFSFIGSIFSKLFNAISYKLGASLTNNTPSNAAQPNTIHIINDTLPSILSSNHTAAKHPSQVVIQNSS